MKRQREDDVIRPMLNLECVKGHRHSSPQSDAYVGRECGTGKCPELLHRIESEDEKAARQRG